MAATHESTKDVYETDRELDELQGLLDRSFASSSAHLTSIMTPERRLDGRRLAGDLTDTAVLDVATVTAAGEPRISAVDGHFVHARWHFTTAGDSPKARQLRARPAISAAYTPRDGYGVFCHGRARFLAAQTPEFDELRAHWIGVYGAAPETLGPDIAYVQVVPTWLVAFAMPAEQTSDLPS